MKLIDLKLRIRSLTRDFSDTTFREVDMDNFINEGIDRIKQVIPHMKDEVYLYIATDTPQYIPVSYHHLLAIYASARLFGQDERHYQAGTLMNEFEAKLDHLLNRIENGEVEIIHPKTGETIEMPWVEDYVVDNYFNRRGKGFE